MPSINKLRAYLYTGIYHNLSFLSSFYILVLCHSDHNHSFLLHYQPHFSQYTRNYSKIYNFLSPYTQVLPIYVHEYMRILSNIKQYYNINTPNVYFSTHQYTKRLLFYTSIHQLIKCDHVISLFTLYLQSTLLIIIINH